MKITKYFKNSILIDLTNVRIQQIVEFTNTTPPSYRVGLAFPGIKSETDLRVRLGVGKGKVEMETFGRLPADKRSDPRSQRQLGCCQ